MHILPIISKIISLAIFYPKTGLVPNFQPLDRHIETISSQGAGGREGGVKLVMDTDNLATNKSIKNLILFHFQTSFF